MKKLIIVLLILLPVAVSAQEKDEYHTRSKKAIKAFEEALRFYRLQQFADSDEMLKRALAFDSNFAEAYMLRATMYHDIENLEKADENYRKVIAIDPDFSAMVYYYLAEINLDMLKIQEARDYIDTFLGMAGLSKIKRQKGEELLALADFRQAMLDNPVEFNPKNLGPGVNGPYFEHSPTLTVDEQILYFTRNQPVADPRPGFPDYDEDLYISYRNPDGTWGKARNLGRDINTPYREGASAISPDGKYLFFTACGTPNSIGSCDIFIAVKKGDSWTKPRNLGSVVNSRAWESQPAFAPDGRTLYFVSNRGRDRKKDIYVTRIDDNGNWTKPVKIPINTPGDDESPFIHPDGETFYFASNGYPGMGKQDLFVCKIDSNGNFSEPVNLGYPINSNDDEVSLVVSADGRRAYYSSGMPGGFGDWDLYVFDLPEEVRPVKVNYAKGKVYDAKTGEPLKARFELINLETGKRMIESFSDAANGEFLVTVPTGKQIALNVSADGYLFYSENYFFSDTNDLTGLAFDVPLKPIEVGETVVLNNVFFEFNSFELKRESKVELDKLVDFLQKNPGLKIEIGGHTDNVGSRDYNQKLSENRARSVYQYLVDHGIAASRLSFKGYNFSQPIATNETEEGRALNRRTEFKIIE